MTFARLKIILNNRQPHLEQAAVRYSTLDAAVREFEAMADRICERPICACCGSPVDQFDPVEWLSEPSRKNPLASAAAVKLSRKSFRGVL